MNAEARTRCGRSRAMARQARDVALGAHRQGMVVRANAGVEAGSVGGLGRRSVWLKRTADSLRWTGQSSARLPARVAKPLIRRARPTSGPARKHGKPDARVAWPAIVDARS